MSRACEEVEAEIGERIVVIRHDVDNLYPVYGGLPLKAANYIFLALGTRASKIAPKRLDHLWELVDLENKYSCKSTFFFRAVTVPSPHMASRLLSQGFEIAYHSDRHTLGEFVRDLRLIERVSGKIRGFTKHGLAPVRSGGLVGEEKLLELARAAGLEYLAQGAWHEEWELPRKKMGVWVFGHHVTLKKIRKEGLREYLESRCMPLILVHPEDLWIPGEKEKLENVLSSRRCITAWEAVELAAKLYGFSRQTR